MNNPITICSYAICGDEPVSFVKRWLKCVKPSDFIVVLCTKPDSAAADYLTSLRQANLFVYAQDFIPWRFDTARNQSLRLAELTGADLYFCSDIDECVIPDFYTDCKKAVEGHPQVMRVWYKFASKVSKQTSKYTGEVDTWFWNNKVHQKGWTWEYPVHETLVCPPGLYKESVFLDENKIYLYHLPDNRPRTSYLPLLELRVEENKDDVYSLFYLMREYSFYRNYDRVLEVGTHLFNVLSKNTDSDMKAITCLYLGRYSWYKGLKYAACGYLKESLNYNPRMKDAHIRLAQYLAYIGDPKSAREVLDAMHNVEKFDLGDWRLDQYLYKPWKELQILADIYCWEGDLEKSKEYIEKARSNIKDTSTELQASWENFYNDEQFILNKYKELK